MGVGAKRTLGARVSALLSFLCGLFGLCAGVMDLTLRLGSIGWFTGGTLLALLAVFLLVDGAVAAQKTR
jgi:hypothetical protein